MELHVDEKYYDCFKNFVATFSFHTIYFSLLLVNELYSCYLEESINCV